MEPVMMEQHHGTRIEETLGFHPDDSVATKGGAS